MPNLLKHYPFRALTLEELKTEIRKGIESGPATPLDIEDIKIRGRMRLKEMKRKMAKR